MKSIKTSGFSLIEVLIVASVISLAFIGVLALVKRAITVYYSNQNALAASVVAQEGLELARYIRDDNWLNNYDFNTNIAQARSDGLKTISAIDYQAIEGPLGRTKIIQFYNSQNPANRLSGLDDSGLLDHYLQDSRAALYNDSQKGNSSAIWTSTDPLPGTYKKTMFNRLLQTTYYDNGTSGTEDDYLYVISMVSWQDRGQLKTYALTTYLYDYSWRY